MKKHLGLFIALALFFTAAFAFAESTEDAPAPDSEYMPIESSDVGWYNSNVPFGASPLTAAEMYKANWAYSSYNFSGQPVMETKALPDGTEYAVQTFVTGEGEANRMTGKLFYVNNMVVAGIEDMIPPEGYDVSALFMQIREKLGDPRPFSKNAMGSVADMIGDAAPLDAIQDLWQYPRRLTLSSIDQTVQVNGYFTAVESDGHIYIVEWFKQGTDAASNKEGLQGVKGYNELTGEEQTAVAMYAGFLEQQKNEKLQQYVDYLLSNHK